MTQGVRPLEPDPERGDDAPPTRGQLLSHFAGSSVVAGAPDAGTMRWAFPSERSRSYVSGSCDAPRETRREGEPAMSLDQSVNQSLPDSDPVMAGCLPSKSSSSPVFDLICPLSVHGVEILLGFVLEAHQQFSNEFSAGTLRQRQGFLSQIVLMNSHGDTVAAAYDSVSSPNIAAAARSHQSDHESPWMCILRRSRTWPDTRRQPQVGRLGIQHRTERQYSS